jgi:aspartate/methionine/tyrosine aminotransferase
MIPFSERTRWDLEPNAFSRILAKKRGAEIPLLDLTLSNPTLAGFQYNDELWNNVLRIATRKPYAPDPRGLPAARQGIVKYYQGRGRVVDPENVLLTTGTSEAYGFLFKLLCDPGDEILVPSPSYPLFGILSELESVQMKKYLMDLDNLSGWRWNREEIARNITWQTKAIVAISPNNPTGSTLQKQELSMISELCREHRMALIVDEVFLDYCHPGQGPKFPSAIGEKECLTFVLSGLSKVAGLPQVKLSWIVTNGPEKAVQEALGRLEFLSDSYLSVSSLTQETAPVLLESCSGLQEQIRTRLRENEKMMRKTLDAGKAFRIFPSDGGWYAVLGLPSGWKDEEAALRLLENENVIVHPGYFYDFEEIQVIIVSLLTQPADFEEGLRRISSAIT